MEARNAGGETAEPATGLSGEVLMRARLDEALVKNGGMTLSEKRAAQREQEDVTRGKQPRTGQAAGKSEAEAAERTEHSM